MPFLIVPDRSVFFTNFNFSQNALTYKFSKNEFHVRFDYKVRQTLLQCGAALIYFEVAQVLLQNRAAFLHYQGDIIHSMVLQCGVSGIKPVF